MPVDASIPLQAQGPPPITLNSLNEMMQMKQQIQAQRKATQVQNTLASIYGDPTNLGPDGMPTSAAMQKIYQVSPEAGQKLSTQKATIDEKMATTSKEQLQAQMDMQGAIQKLVRDPALNAYDNALSQGKSPQQAQAVAQDVYSQGTNDLLAGGHIPDAMKQNIPTAFDATRVRANALSYKDQQALVQKQTGEDLAEKRLDNTEKQQNRMFDISEARLGLAERAGARAEAAASGAPGGMLDDHTTSVLAQQYLAGDTSVMANLGRGKQGAENIVKLRKEIVRQTDEKGGSGADIAASNAEYKGTQAGERTLGTRTANIGMAVNEATQFADLALKASNNMPRGQFTPVNQALQSYDAKTGDPKIRAFGAYNNSLINAYARAISPSGTPTVSDKDHAREMLSTADSPEQYAAVVGAMKTEMTAAQKSPGAVREEFRDAVAPKGKEQKTLTYDPDTGTFK